MALQLDVLIGSAVYSLTAGTPFRLERAEGLGMAPVRRLGESGPYQNGETDLGYRLDPRVVTLSLNFAGTTDAAIDTARSLLGTIAQPSESSTVTLRVTRDDGQVRYLDCYAVGDLDFPLYPATRAGKTMRAVLQLRAANPLWYSPGGTGNSASWWKADNSIESVNAVEVVEYPAGRQQWGYAGTINGDWTIAFSSEYVDPTDTGRYAFAVRQSPIPIYWRTSAGTFQNNLGVSSGSAMVSGTHSYMIVYVFSSNKATTYRDGTVVLGTAPGTGIYAAAADRQWRNDPLTPLGSNQFWPVDLPKAAVYDVALGSAQRQALSDSMLGTIAIRTTSISNGISVSIPYKGDMAEYPILYLTGVGTAPQITNTNSGQSLSFGTTLVMSGTSQLTIDLRPGRQSIVDQAGSNRLNDLTNPNDVVTWRFEPSNDFRNVVTVTGGSFALSATYNSRYMGY